MADASKPITFEVELTKDEIDQLAKWHKDCEENCAKLRMYEYAAAHQDRLYLFNGIQHTGKYMGMPS